MSEVHNDPSQVTAVEGEVQVDGPDGVAVALTPDAAEETSHRLLEGATTALGQQIEEKRATDERENGPLTDR